MYKAFVIAVAGFATFGIAAVKPIKPTRLTLNGRYESCTETLPATPCCSGFIPGHTDTAYIDCGGCALATAHNSICDTVKCDIRITTNLAATTTVTSCAPTLTPRIATASGSDPSVCTSTITKTTNFCGDCGATYDSTATAKVNCNGCGALATSTKTTGVPGVICLCPTDTAVTIVTGCAVRPTPL